MKYLFGCRKQHMRKYGETSYSNSIHSDYLNILIRSTEQIQLLIEYRFCGRKLKFLIDSCFV